MKFMFALVSFVMLTFGSKDVPYSEIEYAFLTKDATSVSKLGNDKLMISLFDKESVYSNQQAALVLKDFFVKYPVNSFKFIFKGKENQDGSFAIASYESKNGNIRITFHFKKIDSLFKIVRMNFEKE
ncbi:MAG: DUF4783 domain-containing protein [Bacteroidota bacterium]